MTREEFARALERLRAIRDPSATRPSDRRRLREDAAAIRALERARKDRTLGTALTTLREGLMRDRRGGRWIAAAWAQVIRAPGLAERCTVSLQRGELKIGVPDHSTAYLLRRELAGGGWVELQRAVPVAMSGYRISVRPIAAAAAEGPSAAVQERGGGPGAAIARADEDEG